MRPYDTMAAMIGRLLLTGLAAAVAGGQAGPGESTVAFELVQPERFSASGGQPKAWADPSRRVPPRG